jgi:Bacterial protein of unknown function (DUF885)
MGTPTMYETDRNPTVLQHAPPTCAGEGVLSLIGQRYLNFMGETFPLMTASENFYTFPRSHAATENRDRLEMLSERSIALALGTVHGLLDQLLRLDPALLPLEDCIDWHLLHSSMASFLRDFERRRVWQTDPLLYVKILNLCCELNPNARLPQLPGLVAEAQRNLRRMPRIAVEIALSMLSGPTGTAQRAARLLEAEPAHAAPVREAIANLERFLERNLTKPETASFACGEGEFEDTLRTLAGLDLTTQALWQKGHELYQEAEEALREIAGRLGRGETLPDLDARLRRELCPEGNLCLLYTRALAEARELLRRQQLLTIPDDGGYVIDIAPTETAWMAAKSTAGYNCPRGQRRAVLHINLRDPQQHAAYALTIAHELYPGHHLQGILARQNPRPIRQQFEIPIFYEGWATYAEKLMVEQGFWPGDVASFFCLKLRRFRAARVLVDVGLHTHRLTLEQAFHLLQRCLPDDLAMREARRYTTTPGYQISYAMGADYLERLRRRFEPDLGLKRFHDLVLQGGDMHWRWVEARLAAATPPINCEEAA